jgi:hypothetical protein
MAGLRVTNLDDVKHVNLPLQPDENSLYLWVKDDKGASYPIAQMRGWGHLTGQGGLALNDAEAEEIQVNFADYICQAVNNHQALVDVLLALEPYLSTEAQMLDAASLNEGRASGFDIASVKARKALVAIQRAKGGDR